MRATETEGNGGSNNEHEVERKKETRMSSSSVCTYILMYSFVCVYPSVVVCSFVNACVIIIIIIREEGEGSQGIHAGDRNRWIGSREGGNDEREYCTALLSVNVQLVKVAVPELYIAPPCRIVFVKCSFANASSSSSS